MIRQLCGAAIALALAASGATDAMAQAYPTKPVRMIVGFPTGGGTDTMARLVGERLTAMWGQNVLVENKPGADGAIATEQVWRSSPDGYTLVVISNAHTVTPSFGNIPYDPVAGFEPVTLLAAQPNLLVVHSSVKANSLQELIRLAKSSPGALDYASGGAGTTPHLAMELLKQLTGMEMLHIPFRGSGPANAALVSGEVKVMFASVSATMGHVRSGKLRALGVTSAQRNPAAPEVPTIAEQGLPGFEATSWYGVLAPAGTPPAIVNKLYADIRQVLVEPDMVRRLTGLGVEGVANSPAEFKQVIVADMARWAPVVKKK